jgi:hypothetical protein
MVRSETPGPAGGDQSLGDLVALAAKDVSKLVKYEIDLAKKELRGDIRRIGLAGGLGAFSFYFGCLVLLLLCFAYAYGLIAVGVWAWLAFIYVALTVLLLAAVAVGIAYLAVRHMSGLRRTRESVTEGLGMLRHEDQQPQIGGDGQRPQIARGPR